MPLAFKDLVTVMLTPNKLTLKYSGLGKGKWYLLDIRIKWDNNNNIIIIIII